MNSFELGIAELDNSPLVPPLEASHTISHTINASCELPLEFTPSPCPSFPLSPDVHVQNDYFDAAVAAADVMHAAFDDILASVGFVNTDDDAAPAAAAFVDTDDDTDDDTDFDEAGQSVEKCIIEDVVDAIISIGHMRPFKRRRVAERACELAKVGRFAADACEHPDASIMVEYCECECPDHNSDSSLD